MAIALKRIVFDHTLGSASDDALSIRRNASTDAPSNVAAYALHPTQGRVLTIQAEFQIQHPGAKSVAIRAKPAAAPTALGEVQARTVQVPESGDGLTGLLPFDLVNVEIWQAGVDIHNVAWSWQVQVTPGGEWTGFATSNLTVYAVLDIPNMPWGQPAVEAHLPAWPWTDVLDWSCRWAKGAKTATQAARRVVGGIWELGEPGRGPRVAYDVNSEYVTGYTDVFRCTSFLNLLAGVPDRQPRMNCSDCATAVVTFANVLGCELAQVILEPASRNVFHLNPVRLIGLDPPAQHDPPPTPFVYHEVAWHPPGQSVVGQDGRVFDATLQIDRDSRPHTFPFVWAAAADNPFINAGASRAVAYRDRLVSPADREICKPTQQDYRRLDNGHGRPPAVSGIRETLRQSNLKRLKDAIGISHYPNRIDALPLPNFSGFRIYRTTESPDFLAELEELTLRSAEWFLESLTEPEVRLRVAMAQTRRSEDAQEVLAWLLTDLAIEVEPRFGHDADAVGDFTFVVPEDRAIFFVRANLAVRMMQIGRRAPLAPMAREADTVFTQWVMQADAT